MIINIHNKDWLYLALISIVLIAGLYGDSISEFPWFNFSLIIAILLMSFGFFQINRTNHLVQANKVDLISSKNQIIHSIELKRHLELESLIKEMKFGLEHKLDLQFEQLTNQICDIAIKSIKIQIDQTMDYLKSIVVQSELPKLKESILKEIKINSDALKNNLNDTNKSELEIQLRNLQIQFSEKINNLHSDLNSKSFSEINEKLNQLKIFSSGLSDIIKPITAQVNEFESKIFKLITNNNTLEFQEQLMELLASTKLELGELIGANNTLEFQENLIQKLTISESELSKLIGKNNTSQFQGQLIELLASSKLELGELIGTNNTVEFQKSLFKKLTVIKSSINNLEISDSLLNFQENTSSQFVSLETRMNEELNSLNLLEIDQIAKENKQLLIEYHKAIKKNNSENEILLKNIQTQNHSYLDFIKAKQLPSMQSQLNKGIKTMYNQIDALFSIYSTFEIKSPMPIFRAWAISPDIAKTIVEAIFESKPQLVVSLGSGVSDLVIGYSLQKNQRGMLYSIEHDSKYAIKTGHTISEHKLKDFVKIETAPLKTYIIDEVEWQWYDYDLSKIPGKIDMLIIDGPPGGTQKLARYPALPLLYSYLAKGCIIILDDAVRADEKEIMKMWASKYDLQFEYLESEKGAYLIKKL